MNIKTTLSSAVQKPRHVPESLVYDFDLFHDPALVKDPHQRVLDLHRNAPPLFWTPRNGGHWICLGYEANFEAARDTARAGASWTALRPASSRRFAVPPGSRAWCL